MTATHDVIFRAFDLLVEDIARDLLPCDWHTFCPGQDQCPNPATHITHIRTTCGGGKPHQGPPAILLCQQHVEHLINNNRWHCLVCNTDVNGPASHLIARIEPLRKATA